MLILNRAFRYKYKCIFYVENSLTPVIIRFANRRMKKKKNYKAQELLVYHSFDSGSQNTCD